MAETDPLLSVNSPAHHRARSAPSVKKESIYDDVTNTCLNCEQSCTKYLNKDVEELRYDHQVYAGRWFILAEFSLLCIIQAATWNTWGPISDTAKAVLSWTDGDIALLTNWGPIAFVITGFIFSYLLLVKGLRFTVLGSALLMLLGVCIRCLPVGIDNIKWTMNIGHIGIGLAGPVLMAAPTEISAVWFPPHQRTTSTAIAATSPFIGVSLSFLIGPKIVTSIPQNSSLNEDYLDPATQSQYFNEIMKLMYIEGGAAAVVVIVALLYFPERPPTSPSLTATKPRESFKAGALMMIKSVHFWIPAIAYSVTTGVFGAWNTQLDTIFKHSLQVGQDTAGWIGFASNIVMLVSGLVIARFVDFMGGRMKAVLLLFLVGSCLSCLWCVLLIMKYISYNLASLYIACIAIGVCVNSPVAVYFEIAVEGMYPVSESNITMGMTFLNNIAALIFLFILMIPNIGVMWMTWLLLGSVVICLPLLMMYKEHYNRLDMDNAVDTLED